MYRHIAASSNSTSTSKSPTPTFTLLIRPLGDKLHPEERRSLSHINEVCEEVIDTIRKLSSKYEVARPSDGQIITIYTLSNFDLVLSKAQMYREGDRKGWHWYWKIKPTTPGEAEFLTSGSEGAVVVDTDTHAVLQLLKREVALLDRGLRGVTLVEAEAAVMKMLRARDEDKDLDEMQDIGFGFVRECRKKFGIVSQRQER